MAFFEKKPVFHLRWSFWYILPEMCTGFPPKNTFIKIHRMCSKSAILSIFAPFGGNSIALL